MLSKIAKLTPMVRVSNRTGSLKEDIKLEDFLKLNDPALSYFQTATTIAPPAFFVKFSTDATLHLYTPD